MKNAQKYEKKTIWIIDHYSSEPEYGGISRHYDFAAELGRRGYHVVVIAAGFSHFTHEYIIPGGREVKVSNPGRNVHYVYLRTPGYEKNNGLGRARNMLCFLIQVLRYEKSIAGKYGKPDVVTGCSVHPLAWIAAGKAAKKYKAAFIAEVRDFWPRVWIVSGEKKFYDPMAVFFSLIQSWAFRKADRIIYSMYHGDKYICGELGIDRSKVYLIGQPMDCSRFDDNRSRTDLLPDEIRKFIGLDDSESPGSGSNRHFICAFAGYYMSYEGVYVMLEALKILKARGYNDIRMVFAGSGQEKEGMQQYIKENGLDHNALVYGRIPKDAVPAFISRSDICMAHLEVKGHKEVYKYGVSKNKINEYLYSGACTVYGFLHKDDEAATSGAGLMFEPYNSKDLADRIESVYKMPSKQRRQFGERGRAYIRSSHSVEVLTDRLTEVLFE